MALTDPEATPRPSVPRFELGHMLGLAAAVVVGFAVVVVVGLTRRIGWVRRGDEAIFDWVVPELQDVPGLADFASWATDLGAIPVNAGMAIALAAVAAVAHRQVEPPLLVIGAAVGAHGVQRLADRVVDGSIPVNHVIGDAGPYFSGGVMRVTLLVGIAATIALPRLDDRWIWRLAIGFGVFEALTRLIVGRHWPYDLVAALPIGLGILWVFRSAYGPWRGHRPS